MDFLSIQLSIRDRQQISNILCQQQPAVVTQAIRDMVTAYEPIIRQCHNAIDLSGTLMDFENFLTDFIRLSKGSDPAGSRPPTPKLVPSRPGTPKPGQNRKNAEDGRKSLPTVEDYVKLLRKHQSASHRFLPQAAKNDRELADKWVKYVKHAVSHFRRKDPSPSEEKEGGAGDMTPALQQLFSNLPPEQKKLVLDALDAYTAYTMALSSASQDKWNAFSSPLLSSSSLDAGPGIYLAKWQHLLNSTRITPATAFGPVRTGKDKSVREKAGVGVETAGNNVKDAAMGRGTLDRMDMPEPPDMEKIIDLLGNGFREEVQKRGRECWEKDI
jgi:hypothetical protein